MHNLGFLIDQSFQGVKRFFVLAFDATDDRKGYSRYYLPTAKVEDYNVMIDRKNVFDQSVKNYVKISDNIRKTTTGQGDDHTIECLLDYNCFKNIIK